MISNFQTIKNICCYEDFVFDEQKLKQFNQVNILYGNNGTGKTTLSNLLFLLSKHCKNKDALYSELFDDNSELEIRFNGSKVTAKNIRDKQLDLYVFNSKFVVDHVYNGNVANVDLFSSEIKLTNEAIEQIDHQLNKASERSAKLKKWQGELASRFENAWLPYNDQFQKKIRDARLTNVKPDIAKSPSGDLPTLKGSLDKLYSEYSKKAEEEVTLARLAKLKENIVKIPEIEFDIDRASKCLSESVSTKAKTEVSARIDALDKAIKEKNTTSVGDLQNWFKMGGRLLYLSKESETTCPLCSSDLTGKIDSIIADYTTYFSNAIIELFQFIEESTIKLDNLIEVNQVAQNINLIKSFIRDASDFKIVFDTFESIDSDLIVKSVQSISQELKSKKLQPEKSISISPEVIKAIGDYNTALKSFKNSSIEKIDLEVSDLQKRNLDQIIKEIKQTIGPIVTLEFNQIQKNVITSKKSSALTAKKIVELQTRLNNTKQDLELRRSQELVKLNTESKYINLYLNYFGITHFHVERIKDAKQNNILITYSSSGKKKNELQHSLSEGEKTALAFAYFISKLRVEKLEGSTGGFNDCIVVIDDPISSLDDSRLFQTANLVDSFLFHNKDAEEKHPLQLFVFSHNITFTKYLYNALKANSNLKDKINEYYLTNDNPRIRKLPQGLKNFTNTYLIKLTEIKDFHAKQKDYEAVKNYLPNYIRIVLETFLSFKLAMVNDGNEMLPGMQSLINRIVKELEPLEDKTVGDLNKDSVIKRLNHLKKIADHESHGSIYRAQEYSFISEDELRIFAKSTVQVISYLDALHYKGVKSLV